MENQTNNGMPLNATNGTSTIGYMHSGPSTGVGVSNGFDTITTASSTFESQLMWGTSPNKKGYKISIEAADFGYTVTVGCKTFCIESPEKLCKYLKKYLKNPAETETKFNKGELFTEE